MAATPEIPVPLFLQAIRRRPEVWSTSRGQASTGDKKRIVSAWKEICRSTWADFDSWSNEQKRTRCLLLQKKWNTLQQDFMKAHGKMNSAKHAYHDLLTFLVPDKQPQPSRREEGESPRPAKRARPQNEESVSEDRHFLLSLESYMRDVPRSSKLALREDMLRLVRKYTPSIPTDTHGQPMDTCVTHSQEY